MIGPIRSGRGGFGPEVRASEMGDVLWACAGGADRFVAVDTETTGVYPADRVAEHAIVTLSYDGDAVEVLDTLSNPRRDVSSPHIHGITASMVRDAPKFDSGLRTSDTSNATLGHAMVQVRGGTGAFTAGVSTGKSKYWETRYTPLRAYEDFVTELAERYWFPPAAPSGPLLPQIDRGRQTAWPATQVLAATMDHALVGTEWSTPEDGSLDFVDIWAGNEAHAKGAPPISGPHRIALAMVVPNAAGDKTIWTGEIGVDGTVVATSDDLELRRGHSNPVGLSELLTERPPTVLFLDGSTVRGRELFPPSTPTTTVPPGLIRPETWTGVDIQAETKPQASQRGVGTSVHEWLGNYLIAQPRRGRHRWIMLNDGKGEIADYVVVETLPNGQVAVDLWHAKFSNFTSTGTRITDFEVVTAQAIKSRRWPTDRRLWAHLAARLEGTEHPHLTVIEGSRRQLSVLLGIGPRWNALSIQRRQPSVVGRIGIVQPGLSAGALPVKVADADISAIQVV